MRKMMPLHNKKAEKDVCVSAEIELCLVQWACGIYVNFEAGARDVAFSSCDGADEPDAQNGMVFCRVERRRLLRQVHEAVSRCIGAAVKARSEREKVSMSALWPGILLPSTWCFSSSRVPILGVDEHQSSESGIARRCRTVSCRGSRVEGIC